MLNGSQKGKSFRLFHALVLTSRGLEDACLKEMRTLERLGQSEKNFLIQNPRLGPGGLLCEVNEAGFAALNLSLRSASRVLWKLLDGKPARGKEDVYRAVRQLKLEDFALRVRDTFQVVASVGAGTKDLNQRYLAMVVKDAICDGFREKCGGERPSVSKDCPTHRVFVKYDGGRLYLSWDTSGRALHERGYRRRFAHEAPLKEHLAAGLLISSGWWEFCEHLHSDPTEVFFWHRAASSENRGDRAGEGQEFSRRIPEKLAFSGLFYDPMCGSGTLPIEAALMLCRRLHARNWSDFALAHIPELNPRPDTFAGVRKQLMERALSVQEGILLLETYRETYKKWCRASRILCESESAQACIYGSDWDPACVRESFDSVQRLHLDPLIQIEQKDFFVSRSLGSGSLVLLNPPYDVRLQNQFEAGYKSLGDHWKSNYRGSTIWMISGDLKELKNVGLRPTRKKQVFNGQLDSRFQQYVIY